MNAISLPPLPELSALPGGTWASVDGATCGVAAGRIKPTADRDDVVVLDAPGAAAGVVTQSTAAAAPARWTRARLPARRRAVVINAGNANAATGRRGAEDAAATAAAVAQVLGCAADDVLVCSTGVIGVPLPMERLLPAARAAAADLGAPGARAARAILTTDTRPKEIAVSSGGITVGGIAKGSGMIHPNMATMLGFFATDARIDPADLQAMLAPIVDRTFNAISVDGDTSTNDAVIVQATGAGPDASPGSAGHAALALALEVACRRLAVAIAADGEGATTLLEVAVLGMADDAAARRAARAVAVSPLVKSAIHGRDPNWGRIVGALGAAGVPDLDALDLDLCGIPVLRRGQPIAWDEAAASAAMDAPAAQITARLPGPGLGRAWGCDLSRDYVSINADYRS